VQAHGGRIELKQVPTGTCFSVTLPVEAEVPEPVRTTGPHAKAELGGTRNDGEQE
jgi:hypothetical protein